MVCYPEVQKEAQAEIDKVLNGRLPEHSDFASLPYLLALVKEIYRYAAVYLNIHCFSLIVFLDGSLYFHLVGPCSFLTYGNELDPYLVKAARISRPTMISTMTITSPPTLLLYLTNGNGHLLPINIQLSSFLKTLLL